MTFKIYPLDLSNTIQKTMDNFKQEVQALIENADLEINRFENEPDYSWTEESNVNQNKLFELATELGVFDYEEEPHHSYLLKATQMEAIEYLADQCEAKLLAIEFSNVLKEWLTTEQMAKVVELNKDADEGICHSHDFCDANMAMDEAFQKVFSREYDFESDKDSDRFQHAWDIAKANNFFTEKV